MQGNRIYRDECGVVSHSTAVSAFENHDPLRPDEPAVFTTFHNAVYLNFEKAKRFQREPGALMAP